ncbi:Protein of unknown function [Tsukamurella pulmonis]|uniref:Uncharacterized protein n=3 Tax=Tsukamurella pulmonis TaxID=47312 RepID=A0A1H1HEQ2_9ACTN|nr:Protein of unknown function [Tsukamurella pulmonis]SUP15067.1 Protein of uncharacterised function (DUF2786) [Tsukamurella pulmonis]
MGAGIVATMDDDRLLSRIGALLRQAEGTDNEHEAATFTEAAQRLATAASIDLAVARAHQRGAERARAVPQQRTVRIGEAGRRGLRTFVELFVAIAQSNDVRCDVASNSTFVFAYGFAEDIDACEALYASLVIQMVRASDAYLRSGAYKSETVQQLYEDRRTRRRWVETKPVAAVTARINFQSAFAARIGARLAEARAAATAQAAERDEPGTAVALRDKEVELASFYQEESSARGRWRGSTASAGYSDGARRAGDRAGRSARLGAHSELGGGRGALERGAP